MSVETSHVILPRIGDRSGPVRYSEIARAAEVEAEIYKKRKYPSFEPQNVDAKRISVESENLVTFLTFLSVSPISLFVQKVGAAISCESGIFGEKIGAVYPVACTIKFLRS